MTEPFDLFVRNGTLVRGAGRRPADVGVRAGRIAAIEAPGTLGGTAVREIDAAGLFVLPGLIDGHVHFREPGREQAEDWLTGSRAAVMGGVTTVLDMPNTLPPTDDADRARHKLRLATGKAHCDFGIFGLLGEQDDRTLRSLVATEGLVGLKVFLGPTTGDLSPPPDERLTAVLRLAARAGVRVAFHAEDRATIGAAEQVLRAAGRHDARAHLESRPVEAELRAIEHVGRLLAGSGAAGHVLHLSSRDGVAAVERLRAGGLDVTCEVTAHHCLLSADDYERLGALIKCNPPVREAEHGAVLFAALADGRIDCVASDHAPHAPPARRTPDTWQAAAGIGGVETTLPLLLTHGVNAGRLTLERLVEAFAERPAQVWGMWPVKGSLAVGSDADMTIVDLQRQGVIRGAGLHSKHGLTPFDGWPTRGRPVATIVRGRVVMEDGELRAEPGWGRPVGREPPGLSPSAA